MGAGRSSQRPAWVAKTSIALSCVRHDSAAHHLANLAKDVLRRDPHLTMAGGTLEQVLGSFLVHHPSIDRAVVKLTEREERGQRDSTVATLERAVLQEGKEECGDLLRERRIRLAAESRDLGALHGIDQAELPFDPSRRALASPQPTPHPPLHPPPLLPHPLPPP